MTNTSTKAKHKKYTASIERFCKDNDGRWTLILKPNFLLSFWLILIVTNHLVQNQGMRLLQSTILFTWAYLELSQGTSSFRRTLGGVIIVGVIVGYFI